MVEKEQIYFMVGHSEGDGNGGSIQSAQGNVTQRGSTRTLKLIDATKSPRVQGEISHILVDFKGRTVSESSVPGQHRHAVYIYTILYLHGNQ